MESTYTIITETKDKNLRKLYWEIALYIKSMDKVEPSDYFKELIQSSINLEIECNEVLNKLKDYYDKFEDDDFNEKLSKESECDFNGTRIYEMFISGGFSFRPFSPSLVFKKILQDKFSYMGTIRPKEKFIELFETERQFCYSDLSITEQLNHIKQFFNDLLDVKQFASMYNKMVISTYIIWYMIGLGYNLQDYKVVLGGELE